MKFFLSYINNNFSLIDFLTTIFCINFRLFNFLLFNMIFLLIIFTYYLLPLLFYFGPLGRSKGFCFVEFSEQSSAIASLDMNSFEIAGRKV